MGQSIDRVEARGRLKPRRDPYWQRLSQGRYVGFRLLTASSVGTWLARFYDGNDYQYKPLGDFAGQPGKDRYDAAKKEAEEWFRHLDRGGAAKSGTVKAACEAYVAWLKVEKSQAASDDARGRFGRLIYSDPIAAVELTKLAPRHFAGWKQRLMENGSTRASFNRNAVPVRAAMNLALARGEVAADAAWRNELKPFKGAEGRRELYLERSERQRLLSTATAEAQRFLRCLMLIPFRPGDVAKLKVEHFDVRQRALKIPAGKTGERVIPLSNEAFAHFEACAKDKLPGAWLVSRDKGTPWMKETWRMEIRKAAVAAKLPLATCAYTLRHCVITDLVTGGLDLFTVAKLSGTSIAMIERHYGHLRGDHAREALEKLTTIT